MKTRRDLLLGLLLITVPAIASAQTRRPQFSDTASLRANFQAVFGGDFELIKDGLNTRSDEQGGGTFWLGYVKPLGPGHFTLQYSFKRDDKHYSHEERDIFFTVAPRGCRRGPPASGVYARFCVGDTIIVPVIVSGANGHEFRLTKQAPAENEDWRTFEEKYPENRGQLAHAAVANPSQSLRYLGQSAHKRFHRNLGYTLQLVAVFEAVKSGKFNLSVASSPQPEEPDETPPGSQPIIVVERDTPVTLIAGREQVRGFTMGPDGREYVSSTSGNSYMTNLIVLQPGDRISIQYLSLRRSGEFERRRESDPAEGTTPVISVHPFQLDPAHDYSGWLVDYLP